MPHRNCPPGSVRSPATASATAGAVRSVQPTTPASRGPPRAGTRAWSPVAYGSRPAASASRSGVSQGSVTVWMTTVPVIPAAAASGTRSASVKDRRSRASSSSVAQGWASMSQRCSRAARSHRWWCASITTAS